MTTLKEIADLAGVSRGTVDRVLNHRGSVNPKTAEKVMNIAQALNYQPNRAGTALAAQKKKYKIGVILFGKSNPFFDEVMRGIRAKSNDLKSYGITTMIRRVDFEVQAQLEAIDELVREGMNGLVLAPYNDKAICERIDMLKEEGIPVVTVNTDIEGSHRMAYVGIISAVAVLRPDCLHCLHPATSRWESLPDPTVSSVTQNASADSNRHWRQTILIYTSSTQSKITMTRLRAIQQPGSCLPTTPKPMHFFSLLPASTAAARR